MNNWFDQTMDRVSQRFTASTRAITFVAAFLLAVVLQVDAVLLVNRLSADDKMRDAFLAQARSMHGVAQTGADAAGTPEGELNREYLSFLSDHGVIAVPRTLDDWAQGWGTVSPFGILVTGLLLSLGAPFWYTQLGRLLQFRSVLAEKDDQQRVGRQGTEPWPAVEGHPRRPGFRANGAISLPRAEEIS